MFGDPARGWILVAWAHEPEDRCVPREISKHMIVHSISTFETGPEPHFASIRGQTLKRDRPITCQFREAARAALQLTIQMQGNRGQVTDRLLGGHRRWETIMAKSGST